MILCGIPNKASLTCQWYTWGLSWNHCQYTWHAFLRRKSAAACYPTRKIGTNCSIHGCLQGPTLEIAGNQALWRRIRAHNIWISLFPTKFPNSLFGAKFWIQMQPNCSIVALCVLNDRHMYALTVAFILGCRIVNVADWVIRLYNAQQYTHMTLVEFSNPVQ